jgi:hypothetical protein
LQANLLLPFILVFGCIAIESAWGAAPMISEFMALNNSTLQDEDGSYSDWIELYNPGTNAVDLTGWYLSTWSTNLTQWQFPATNLAPHGFLLVFASNKDRRTPGSPLHTSFKLSGSGEYLALVMPDGMTKVSEFSPAFPPQFPDVSYGRPMTGTETTLVAPTAPALALVPTADIGSAWRQDPYGASSWLQGSLAAGYDTSTNYASAIGLNLQAPMLNANASAYLRVPFTVPDPFLFGTLTLGLRYDDGFVAYLNGTEVLRKNAPAALAWNSSATSAHGIPVAGSLNQNFDNSASNYVLTQYGSGPVPSVQATNTGSTGKFLRLLYDGVGDSINSVTFTQTAPGLFQTVIAEFDFRLTSSVADPADGLAFMLVPTSLYGTNGPGVNLSTQVPEQPNYRGVLGIGFRVYPHTSVNNVSVHWDGVRQSDALVPFSAIDLVAGVFHHAKITVQFATGGAFVSVALTSNINGTLQRAFTPFNSLFVPGVKPFDSRVQFGARTGGLNMACDLDNCSVQFIPPQGLIEFEDFELGPFLGSLLTGSNVLAVQGLNLSPTNSSFLIQPQLTARQLTVADAPAYLYPPTPGKWNDSAAASAVPGPVTFLPPPGLYRSNALVVRLAGSSSSDLIHFTLDGTPPTLSSRVYTNAILLTTNATVRASAESSGVLGGITAAAYFLLDSSVTNFSSNLPLVIIDTLGQTVPDNAKVSAYAIVLSTNLTTGRASLSNGNADYTGQLGIGLHGSSSLMFPKQPFAIELRDEHGDSRDYPLLGFPPGNDWLLYPSYDDKTFLNNYLTEELFRGMGHYGVRCQFAELFLRSAPGKLTGSDYRGIYILIERIRVDSNRVDIARLKRTDTLAPDITGGYIISKDKINEGDVLFTTPSGQELIVNYPSADDLAPAQYSYISGYINSLEAALYGANWRDPLTGYAAYLDADSFVDYHWIIEYPKNIDGVRISNYMTKDRPGKLKTEPIWDWDLSWGNANYAEGGKTNGWYYPLMSDQDDIWFRRLRTDPDFYQKIIDRWGALRLNVFNATNLLARVDQLTNYLWEAQARDFVAWPRLGTAVWPNPDGAAGGWDVDYVHPTTYSGIIAQFKKFILGRYLWIDQQFVPSPTLLSNVASTSLSAPLGSIYYTLDGSDPRATGGAVSPSAHLYTGTIALTANAAIVARTFYTNSWSPPVRELYISALPALRITEINYHPYPPPSNSAFSDKDFEFIEIQNTGPNPLNLAGARLGGGIQFTFPSVQLVSAGTSTASAFDGAGTPFTASTLNQGPGAYLTNDALGGMFLRLLDSGASDVRNRVTFNQTSTGAVDRVTVDFDFRASAASSGGTQGIPTLQDFDSAGARYTLTNRGTASPAILNGDAGSSGKFLRLVPSAGQQVGVIAFDADNSGAFSTIVSTFDFRITPPAGGQPADGLGFALLNTALYGSAGPGPFFGEEPNLPGSLGVGFDVYANASTAQEPNNNHVSLHWNSFQVGSAANPSFTLANGRFHRAQVITAFAGTNAYVTVRLTPDIDGTPGATETLFANVLIAGVTPYRCRTCFGARTGGSYAAHDLDNVNIQFLSDPATRAGLSILLLPVDSFGATGPGTTLATFTDEPRVANTIALDLSFDPSQTFNDASLYWNKQLVANSGVSPLNLAAELFHHAHLELTSTNGSVIATLLLTSDILGAASPVITVYTNLSISGAALGTARLELAGRNGGLSSRVDLDNIAARFETRQPLVLAPGGFIVVVHNLEAFRFRYGDAIPVAGEFSGSLSNSGDELSLFGPLGEPILDFWYNPAWFPSTDGGGSSLVVVDPYAPPSSWGLGSSWRPSSNVGGSPGTADATAQPVTLVIGSGPAPGQLTLTWPGTAATYDVYSTTNLSLANSWTPLTNSAAFSAGRWSVSLPIPGQGSYYRLIQR